MSEPPRPGRPGTGPAPTLLVLAAGVLAAAAPGSEAAAQQPVTSVGLGYPTPPDEARAAALGGVGVGLLRGTLTVRNPADLVALPASAVGIALSGESIDVEGSGGSTQSTGRSALPIAQGVFRSGDWAFGAAFGSVLNQDWNVRFRDTLVIAAGDFPFEEQRESNGGLSTLNLALARSLGPASVGISYDLLVGSVTQLAVRRFASSLDSLTETSPKVEDSATWGYGGGRIRVGAGLELLGGRARVSAAYAASGDLDAEREEADDRRDFGMPASVEAGASVRIGSRLMVAAGGGWSGWSELDDDLRTARADDHLWLGGGVEYRGAQLGPLPLVLRAGGRYAELPFSLPGEEPPTERAFTAGLGSAFADGRVQLDAALELGSRGSVAETGMEESYRRLTFSATIFNPASGVEIPLPVPEPQPQPGGGRTP